MKDLFGQDIPEKATRAQESRRAEDIRPQVRKEAAPPAWPMRPCVITKLSPTVAHIENLPLTSVRR